MPAAARRPFYRPALPRRAVFGLAVLTLLAACAPQTRPPQLDNQAVDAEAKIQRELVLRDQVEKYDRLYRVAWNIRARNADLCGGRLASSFGVSFLELDDYKGDRRETVKNVLGVHSRPTVFQAAPGGPADVAGLRRGDVIKSVDGQATAHKKELREALAKALKDGRTVRLGVERAGEPLELSMAPAKICGYPVQLEPRADLNAYADGSKIVVLYGMLKFVKSDDELAAIVGHELAHNTQNHIRDQNVNAAIGKMLIDLPVMVLLGVRTHAGERMGGQAFSPQYETEADYVGLYYTARAGYDIHHVADVWRRMSIENPGGITLVTSHPSHSQRFVGLEADAAEIDKKRAEGQPLVPNMKNAPTAPKPDQPAEPDAASDSVPGTDPI